MSRESRLRQVLNNPRIWRRGENTAAVHTAIPTGFGLLDEWLGGGWPVGVLTELLLDEEGAGELRLLMPALAQLSCAENPDDMQVGGSWIAWVAPPHVPYPPALLQHGVNVSRLLITQPENQKDRLWAMEQALRSEVCGAALGWLGKADDRSLRRLQLAAESGRCWAIIFRRAGFAYAPSPAPLRIRLEADAGNLRLHVLRNRYGRHGMLSLPC